MSSNYIYTYKYIEEELNKKESKANCSPHGALYIEEEKERRKLELHMNELFNLLFITVKTLLKKIKNGLKILFILIYEAT